MKLFNWKKKKKEVVFEQPKMSNPYVIQIKNTTDEQKNFVLFGSAVYLNAENYGSDEGLEITNLGTDAPYSAILQEFVAQRAKMTRFRFQSDSKANLFLKLTLVRQKFSSGWFENSKEEREIPLSIMWDAYQMQSDIMDANIEFELDRYAHISGTILPKSIFVISMFPVEIDSEAYKATRISGKSIAPVIIQVNGKGLAKAKGKIVRSWDKFIGLFKKNKS